MSARLVSQRDINDALETRFDSASPFIYKTVLVLLLYWKDADSNFKGEADKLERLFGGKFHYQIQRFEIPSQNSAICLNKEISLVIDSFSTPRSLVIIHYGGHGDDDDDRQKGEAFPPRRSVWAARADKADKAVLEWSVIQPQLGLGRGDFLLILDCCFGAQASRASWTRTIPGNVELLAAAPMKCSTPGPGPNSFTHAFIEAIESALSSQGHADISELHQRLASRDIDLVQTPVHFSPLQQSTIRLQPHQPTQRKIEFNTPETMLIMEMVVRSPLDEQLLDKVVRWLLHFVPREVAGLRVTELTHKAQAAHQFVVAGASEERSATSGVCSALSINALPDDEARSELKTAWSLFTWSLWDSLRSIVPHDRIAIGNVSVELTDAYGSDGDDISKILDFLRVFDTNMSLLTDVIERNVLAIPELLKEVDLTDAINDPTAADLGIVKSLQMRLQNLRFENGMIADKPSKATQVPNFKRSSDYIKVKSLVSEAHPSYGRVLIEYSFRVEEDTKDLQSKHDSRMVHLSRLLEKPDQSFDTPTCLGWTAFPKDNRYGLIFRNPYHEPCIPTTLYDILEAPGRDRRAIPRPTLGQRFRIAQMIGRTLLKWHDVGWVHESISSQNIIFSRSGVTDSIDYTKPLLCGFSFSRPTTSKSTPSQGVDDVIRDVYQHPDRQGIRPNAQHTKEHDLYSFGVLLYEIGIWKQVPDQFGKYVQPGKVRFLRQAMLDRVDRLGAGMGTSFVAATRLCLEGNFGIRVDDKVQSRLARKFEHSVLRKLEIGTRLDDA